MIAKPTTSSKKHKAGQALSVSGPSQMVTNHFSGFSNINARLGPHPNSTGDKRALPDAKRAQQERVFDRLRSSIRSAIREVYTTGSARSRASIEAQQAIAALQSIIVGNSKLLKHDSEN